MKIALNVLGVLMVLMGGTWFLQGINVLTAGKSPMIGDTRWAYYGGITAAIGLVSMVMANRKR
jgi:hypothetical protein